MDERQAMAIDARASQLNGATQRENLGLAIKHDSVATIRKVGEDLVFTPDQLAFVISEIKKCRKDIVYFANTYFRIIGDGGLQIIKLYPKQEEMLRAMQKESRLIVLAPRQVGKSTTYSIYFLWQTMFFPDKRIAIASDAAAKSEEILARIKLAYEYLPKEIKPAVTAYSTKQIAFDNNSEIRAFATGGNTLAGFSMDTIALDEFALIRWSIADTFFSTTMPVISSRKDSKAIIVSTPRGTVNNKFYDLWSQANSVDQSQNKDGWVPFRIDWWDVPGRTEEWKNARIAEMGIEKFQQEYGCEFSSSGDALLIPDEVIHKFRRALDSSPEPALINLSDDEQKPINAEIWKEYIPGHTYVAGADVCEGTGNDASAIYIMDVTDLKQGVSISAKIASASLSVLDFANSCSILLKQYNYPCVIVENNGVGSGFVEALIHTFNVPASRVFSEMKKDGEIRYGIHSNNAVKLEAALFTRELLTTEEIPFTIPDKHLIDEMTTFIRRVNQSSITYKASGKSHDDHIMAFIWGLYLLHYRNIEKYYAVKEAFKAKRGQVLPGKVESTHNIEDPEELVKSQFHKLVVATLNNDPSALDIDLNDDRMKNAKQDESNPLYYGASGRGYSFGKKSFMTINEGYSQFDWKKAELRKKDDDEEDQWEPPYDGQNVFMGI